MDVYSDAPMVRVGVIGASGYTGAELLRLLAGHPELELAYATGDSSAGVRAAELYPSLAAAYPDLVFESYEPSAVDGLDLVFLGLPHGASQAIVPDLRKRVDKIIDLAIGAQVLFTPHLAPMNRGILATCYARPVRGGADPMTVLREAYVSEPFVVVTETSPSTKATLGSNTCHITARVDERTGWVVVLSALDNLVKGASGQAVQCANLSLGINETAG